MAAPRILTSLGSLGALPDADILEIGAFGPVSKSASALTVTVIVTYHDPEGYYHNVEGAAVLVDGNSVGTTDGSGEVTTSLEAGSYSFEARPATSYVRKTQTTAVAEGSVSVTIFVQTGVQGFVTNKATAEALAGLQVDIYVGANQYSDTTGADGYYGLEIDAAAYTDGDYPVYCGAGNYVYCLGYGTVTVTDAFGEHDFELLPAQGGMVYGLVLDADTGLPIEGATVTVGVNGTTTDAEGWYYLWPMPAFNYTITAEADGYETGSGGFFLADSETVQVNFALTAEAIGSISGNVVDQDAAAVQYARVFAAQGTYSWSTLTDALGDYTIAAVPQSPEDYTVFVRKAGYSDSASQAVTVDGDETGVNFVINRIIHTVCVLPSSVYTDGSPFASGGHPS